MILSPMVQTALAASFDCRRVSSRVERRICENHHISCLDEELDALEVVLRLLGGA